MATTYTLISSNVLSSSAASVTFSAIPATYTDLVVRASVRDTSANVYLEMFFQYNGTSTSVYSVTKLTGTAGAASSTRQSNQTEHQEPLATSANATASTFSSVELYIPNYASANNKVYSDFSVSETNATTTPAIQTGAGLFRSTDAITSIAFFPTTGNFDTGTSFYLYGISNA